MTYVLRLATEETRDLVVTSLRAAADQRTRVARGAAGQVAEERRAGRDVRTKAVKVTALLAEADTLAKVADELATAEAVHVVERAITPPGAFPGDPAVDLTRLEDPTPLDVAATSLGDDGTSAAAQRIAALAGLTPADPDAVEDPLTGALPEDTPTTAEEVLP